MIPAFGSEQTNCNVSVASMVSSGTIYSGWLQPSGSTWTSWSSFSRWFSTRLRTPISDCWTLSSAPWTARGPRSGVGYQELVFPPIGGANEDSH